MQIIKRNFLFPVIMFVFCALTLSGVLSHEVWYDETQAWLIAQDLNFLDILYQMKTEGHLFLWFLLLKPLTKIDLPYPYAMQIINLLIMWITVFVLWKKTNLHPIIKILITFSTPICYQYSVLARCYSLALLLLLLLIVFFKDKLKRPILYTLLLFFAANTSPLFLPTVSYIGLLFLYEYIKGNKIFYKKITFWFISVVCIFCAGLIFYQLIDGTSMISGLKDAHLHDTSLSFLLNAYLSGITAIEFSKILNLPFVQILLFISIFSLIIATFWNRKKSLYFFLLPNAFLLLFFTFIYNGYIWHWMLFYVNLLFLIIFDSLDTVDKGKMYKNFIIFFIIVSFLNCRETFYKYENEYKSMYSGSEYMAKRIIRSWSSDETLIVSCHSWCSTFAPFFRNAKIDLYNCFTEDIQSFSDIKNEKYGIGICYLSPEFIRRNKNKTIYALLPQKFESNFKNENYDIELLQKGVQAHNDFEYISSVYRVIPKNHIFEQE